MRLLVITQKIDHNDQVLGFFHRWAESLAEYCEKLTIVCLELGENKLSPVVKVLSLGKEKRVSRFRYLINFYRYLWQERQNYDVVLVHMNEEYVLLAGWWWRLTGKKIFLWRNHPSGSWRTRLAVRLVYRVFCTSPHSFTARFKKTKLMPVGIDTKIFYDRGQERRPRSILFLGRVSRIKNPELLLAALEILTKQGINFEATIVGDPVKGDEEYSKQLKQEATALGEMIRFLPGVPNWQTPEVYNQYEIYVNLTPTGSFDKTIPEALACGSLPVVINQSLAEDLSAEYLSATPAAEIAAKISFLLDLPEVEKAKRRLALRNYVEEKHSLELLITKLMAEFDA